MSEIQNENSGTNTILIVLVLVAIVGFGVWFFSSQRTTPATDNENGGLNVDVNLPAPQNSGTPPPTNPAPQQ